MVNIYISANGDLLYCKGNISDKGVFTENTLSLGVRKKSGYFDKKIKGYLYRNNIILEVVYEI